ncbi:MAG: hypothetical protein KCHDKBKB_03002 [Elusimicrobia bacterium]|nr:hypothetical protein [Elusimicrobiota bacterium]
MKTRKTKSALKVGSSAVVLPFSRGESKIRKALQRKGYNVGAVTWEPIRKGGIMCGPEGGWHVEILRPRPDSVSADLLAYSCGEMLLEIEGLPRQNEPSAGTGFAR